MTQSNPTQPAIQPTESPSQLHAILHDGLLVHIQALLEIVVIATFVATFIVQPFRIPSASMRPTLRIGDFLLGDKQCFSPSGLLDHILPPTAVHRGDLIVFHYPIDPSRYLVKRVIGLPGDHLRLLDGRVYLNGNPLAEPYAVYAPAAPDTFRDDFPSLRATDPNVDPDWWAQLRRTVTDGQLTVPANHYFVMGDNRNDSEDSRYWGFVPRDAIVARPFIVYFSIANPPAIYGSRKPSVFTRLRSNLFAEIHNIRILR